MTYKQAKTIQTLVLDLNGMNTETSYECYIEPRDNESQYICYLYSNKDSQLEYLDLYQLALGIHSCVAEICLMPDRTTIQLRNEFRQSIRMF